MQRAEKSPRSCYHEEGPPAWPGCTSRMEDLDLLGKGALAGLAISASVGPVNVLCISSAITKGRVAGLIAGLGAAAADTLYGTIAGFSISFIIDFLLREIFWVRLVGGLLLIAIGIGYCLKKPKSMRESSDKSAHSDWVTAFLLNLANPTTVLSFLAVLAVLGMGHRHEWWHTLILIAGIFSGAMSWWVTLAFIVGHFRDRFNDRSLLWLHRIAGAAIGGFGAVMMLLAILG
jgi:threonine/homoserine/homoserine lactone efflux protein